MKKKRAKVWAIAVFLFLITIAIGGWYFYNSNIKYTDISFYAWITNDLNSSLTATFIYAEPEPGVSLNFTSAIFKVDEGLVTAPSPDGSKIQIFIKEIKPGQTLKLEVYGIPNSAAFESQTFSGNEPISFSTLAGGLKVNYVSQFFASTLFGRLNLASIYTHTEDQGLIHYEPRTYTSWFALFAFFCIVLLTYGAFLHASGLYSGTRYPFVTLIILLLNVLTYAFVGTGWEVNQIPSLAIFKNPLMSVTFHGSFEHITGNLSPFIICALLLES
jgi:hypothetical protein